MSDYRYRFIVYLILLILSLFLVGVVLSIVRVDKPLTEANRGISECFYYQPKIPYIPDTYVLGTIIDETLYKIIECESNFRPDVCSYAGCEGGMGLGQLIPSTVKYCEEKLDRNIDPFNPEDNLDCTVWLYENEGCRHWRPSAHCHKCYE